MALRYFEDFPEGYTLDLGTFTLSADEIIAFARAVRPAADARRPRSRPASIYGGLIASGWHTAACYMRLLVDGVIGESASMGSPGIDNLRWLKPVRPTRRCMLASSSWRVARRTVDQSGASFDLAARSSIRTTRW